MKITGWTIQVYTNEFHRLGYVKESSPVEFGNSPIQDKRARLEYIEELVREGKDFTVTPIVKEN